MSWLYVLSKNALESRCRDLIVSRWIFYRNFIRYRIRYISKLIHMIYLKKKKTLNMGNAVKVSRSTFNEIIIIIAIKGFLGKCSNE